MMLFNDVGRSKDCPSYHENHNVSMMSVPSMMFHGRNAHEPQECPHDMPPMSFFNLARCSSLSIAALSKEPLPTGARNLDIMSEMDH